MRRPLTLWDGYDDIIVGARDYDNGQTDEGRAWLYLGSASGLGTSAAWTAEPDDPGASFGQSVASAGDVNGDGYDDVIVGAHYYTNGQSEEGGAFLYLGSATGLETTAAWTVESNQAYSGFGCEVASAGDVNGDGYDDVVVGALWYDNDQSQEGRAWLYLGSAIGPNTTAAWSAEGDQVGAAFGHSVASSGDVNGDGYDDLLVGASGYDNGSTDEGRAFLYLGSSTGLATSPAWTAESDQSTSGLGIEMSVVSAGDVNGDGYDYVIVGAAYYDDGSTDEGRASLHLGSSAGLDTEAAWTAESDQAGARLGWSVASAGDVNADGYDDVAVGAYLYDNGSTDEGRAFLYLGPNLGVVPPTLATLGTCGGPAGLDLAGFTPSGTVILLASTVPGPGRLRSGTCFGTDVDMKNPRALPSVTTVDADGELRVMLRRPVACGTYIQAVDVSTCAVSNVVGF